MSFRPAIQCLFLSLLCCALVGCGGNGSSVGPTAVKPKLTIDWGTRAFDIGGPSSAVSVVVTFRGAGAKGQDVSFAVDRTSGPASYKEPIVSPTAIRSGAILMHIGFFSQAGGLGAVVGTLDASVQIDQTGNLLNANGGPLGTIQATGTIARVFVVTPLTFSTGLAADVPISTFDLSLQPVALTPGSVFLQVTPGTGSGTITPKGQFLGQTAGTVSIVATVDAVSSPVATANVTLPPVAYSTLTQATNSMVYDSATGHLWASVPGSDSKYGNDVIEIDPNSQTIVSSIPVGSEPNALALSDDNSTLYVSLTGANAVRRVDLTSHTAGLQFSVTGNSFANSPYAFALAVQPGNPNVVAVTLQDPGDTGSLGPQIYDNGVVRPNGLGIYEGLFIGFTSPTTIWSGMTFEPAEVFQANVDASGATKTGTFGVLSGVLKTFGSKVVLGSGQVLDGATGTMLGTYPANGDYTVDLAAGRAFCLSTDTYTNAASLIAFDASTFRELSMNPVPNFTPDPYAATQNLTRFGTKSLAFRSQSTVYFIAAAPGL